MGHLLGQATMTDHTPYRRCKQCSNDLPLTPEFWHRDKTDKYGFAYTCKSCASARSRKWSVDNHDYVLEKHREYYHNNKAAFQAYRAKNAEHIAEWRREHRNLKADDYRRWKSDSQKRNRDSANIRSRRFNQRHPERLNIGVHRRLARKAALPFAFTDTDWNRCLEYWRHRCCVCGAVAGFWTVIAKEHWIAMTDPCSDNPGTVRTNIVPMCHSMKDGEGGCNNLKGNRDPVEWLHSRYGKRKATAILQRVEAYFESIGRLL